jgi:hypothetical protein
MADIADASPKGQGDFALLFWAVLWFVSVLFQRTFLREYNSVIIVKKTKATKIFIALAATAAIFLAAIGVAYGYYIANQPNLNTNTPNTTDGGF